MEEIVDISKEIFSLGFKGENDIDLKELLNSLDGAVQLIDYISRSLDDNSFINVKVKGSRKGSFLIDLIAIAKDKLSFFNTENISFAKLCIDTFCGLLKLKKHLKGDKPKSVKEISEGMYLVENKDCENITVNNYVFNLQGPECDQAIKRIFPNCNRPGIYVKKHDEIAVEIDKQDFDVMVKDIEMNTNENKIIKTSSDVTVKIKKPDFTGGSKWELIYNNKIIKAAIKDTVFMDNIHKGEISITAITNAKVKLITETKLNEIGEVIKTTHYVEKVIDINNKPSEQMQFKI